MLKKQLRRRNRKEKPMKLNLLRSPTQADTKLAFDFAVAGSEFLVKNFTDGDILVSFDENEENPILIPAECSQVCITGQNGTWNPNPVQTVYVLPDATSEKGVEVQCLKW